MIREDSEKPRRRPRKRRTRDVSYRKQHLDPYLDLDRKKRAGSFVPILARLFRKLPKGRFKSGKWLAENCRHLWSPASVWEHLHWLVDRKIMIQAYDGKKMFFGWNPEMPKEAGQLTEDLYAACQRYWDVLRRANRRSRRR